MLECFLFALIITIQRNGLRCPLTFHCCNCSARWSWIFLEPFPSGDNDISFYTLFIIVFAKAFCIPVFTDLALIYLFQSLQNIFHTFRIRRQDNIIESKRYRNPEPFINNDSSFLIHLGIKKFEKRSSYKLQRGFNEMNLVSIFCCQFLGFAQSPKY